MNTQRLTIKSQELVSAMQELATENGHQQITDLHLLAAMLDQAEALIHPILSKLEVQEDELTRQIHIALQKLPRVQGGQVYLAQEVLDIMRAAEKEADRLGDDYISGEHILLALLNSKGEAGRILKSKGITADRLLSALKEVRGNQRVTDQNPEAKYQALEKYSRNLTSLARTEKLDPVIGDRKSVV